MRRGRLVPGTERDGLGKWSRRGGRVVSGEQSSRCGVARQSGESGCPLPPPRPVPDVRPQSVTLANLSILAVIGGDGEVQNLLPENRPQPKEAGQPQPQPGHNTGLAWGAMAAAALSPLALLGLALAEWFSLPVSVSVSHLVGAQGSVPLCFLMAGVLAQTWSASLCSLWLSRGGDSSGRRGSRGREAGGPGRDWALVPGLPLMGRPTLCPQAQQSRRPCLALGPWLLLQPRLQGLGARQRAPWAN